MHSTDFDNLIRQIDGFHLSPPLDGHTISKHIVENVVADLFTAVIHHKRRAHKPGDVTRPDLHDAITKVVYLYYIYEWKIDRNLLILISFMSESGHDHRRKEKERESRKSNGALFEAAWYKAHKKRPSPGKVAAITGVSRPTIYDWRKCSAYENEIKSIPFEDEGRASQIIEMFEESILHRTKR